MRLNWIMLPTYWCNEIDEKESFSKIVITIIATSSVRQRSGHHMCYGAWQLAITELATTVLEPSPLLYGRRAVVLVSFPT